MSVRAKARNHGVVGIDRHLVDPPAIGGYATDRHAIDLQAIDLQAIEGTS